MPVDGTEGSGPDPAYLNHQQARRAHWDGVARQMDDWQGLGGAYHRRLEQVLRFLVPPGQRILELGCGRGDLLAALQPALGVGIDFSGGMIERARKRHPHLRFLQLDVHEMDLHEEFDTIILSDLVNDLWDVQKVFERLGVLCTPKTRLILNSYSRLWEQPLALAEKLGLAKPTLRQNWLTVEDVVGLLGLAGFEVIRTWHDILWPLPTPILSDFLNRFVVKVWPFGLLAMTNFVIGRPRPAGSSVGEPPRVSVIVPVRNEAGNIPELFQRLPAMGAETEMVFVEGHSRDDSYHVVESEMARHPERRCQLLRQAGEGKGDAVRLGFSKATGDMLMILDADLTVPPEDLPRFYAALTSGNGDLVNGVRLVYPIEGEAMRFLNLVGNKLFTLAFSWILGQPVKDTLCGTKALWKRDYEAIAANRGHFGDFDPFGDFDLLFGAAKLNMKFVDMPVRYRKRTYGATNIRRWSDGWLLARMAILGALRLKFV